MTKVGDLEIPYGFQAIISFPGRTQNEVNEIKKAVRASKGSILLTNMKFTVVAKTDSIIILEAAGP